MFMAELRRCFPMTLQMVPTLTRRVALPARRLVLTHGHRGRPTSEAASALDKDGQLDWT